MKGNELAYLSYHVRSNVQCQIRNAVNQQENKPAGNATPDGHVTQLKRSTVTGDWHHIKRM